MKTTGLSFYFVLYVVAIITVFAITVERDHLLEQRDDVIAHLVAVYVKPLHLSATIDTARFFVEPTRTLTRDSIAIRIKAEGPIEKSDIVYVLYGAGTIDASGGMEGIPVAGRVMNEDGEGLLIYPPVREGTYEFKVSGYKRRILLEGNSMRVRVGDTSYVIPYSGALETIDRDTTILIARVVRAGVVPPQLTLGVQESQENWVLGPAYRKKVFVGGVERLDRVSFSVGGPARIEVGTGPSAYATLVWDKPVLGKHSFAVSADAHRGFGEKDRAKIAFNVDVLPATFVSTPPSKGFWGIPYAFDGQLVGLNPLDITVDVLHDGQSMGVKPVVPKVLVKPERNWNTLLFKILYRETVIKEHKVSLSAPPPPQIRWVQQNLDRDRKVFTIKVASEDPTGGPVRMSIEAQPSGIAKLDRIQSTTFTISVDLSGRPSALFLKLTAADQYGGRSTSSKQFNIPQ
jgi:hypothetical protein